MNDELWLLSALEPCILQLQIAYWVVPDRVCLLDAGHLFGEQINSVLCRHYRVMTGSSKVPAFCLRTARAGSLQRAA